MLTATNTSVSTDFQSALRIGGDRCVPAEWSTDALRKRFARDLRAVSYTFKGQRHTSECIPLLALLGAAGAPTELVIDPRATPRAKHANTRLLVVVQGRDGFSAIFCLAELMPEIGNRAAWLALDIDGEPLDQRSGPIKLIVPADEKPVRWVHAVQAITLQNDRAS